LIGTSDGMFCGLSAALLNASEGLPQPVFQRLLDAHDALGRIELSSLVTILSTDSDVRFKFQRFILKEPSTFLQLFINVLNENKEMYVISYSVGVKNTHTIYWNSKEKYVIDSDENSKSPFVYESENDIERIVTQLHANVICEQVLNVYKRIT